jgi:hypothetical protein
MSERLLMFLVSSDLAFWLARKLARNMLIKTVLGTPPDVVSNESLQEQARVDRILQNIQPIGPRALGIRNDARITRSLGRFNLKKDCRPHARRERTRRPLRDLCQRPIHCPTHSGRSICRLRQWWSLVGWAR